MRELDINLHNVCYCSKVRQIRHIDNCNDCPGCEGFGFNGCNFVVKCDYSKLTKKGRIEEAISDILEASNKGKVDIDFATALILAIAEEKE